MKPKSDLRYRAACIQVNDWFTIELTIACSRFLTPLLGAAYHLASSKGAAVRWLREKLEEQVADYTQTNSA